MRAHSMGRSLGGNTRNSDAAIAVSASRSSLCASAPKTSRPWRAITPATLLNVPGRSGLTTVMESSVVHTANRPSAIISSTSASGKSFQITSRTSPPPNTWCTRPVSSYTKPAFQSLHAETPVAFESASVSARNRSSATEDLISVATPVIVASSLRSRRVAVSASNKWC